MKNTHWSTLYTHYTLILKITFLPNIQIQLVRMVKIGHSPLYCCCCVRVKRLPPVDAYMWKGQVIHVWKGHLHLIDVWKVQLVQGQKRAASNSSLCMKGLSLVGTGIWTSYFWMVPVRELGYLQLVRKCVWNEYLWLVCVCRSVASRSYVHVKGCLGFMWTCEKTRLCCHLTGSDKMKDKKVLHKLSGAHKLILVFNL